MINENIDVITEKKFSWNVIVTLYKEGFKDAIHALSPHGVVRATNFFNVLVMHVEDMDKFLHDFAIEMSEKPYLGNSISRLTPVMRALTFNSREEFEDKAKRIADEWVDLIAGKTFYVRMHRRGFREKISSLDEEQFLDRHLLKSLDERGLAAKITFTDPDFIIDVETLNNQGSLSIWSRDDIKAYPFLHLD
ncbi:MAG: THUMP domain-containing protein [Bacteriovorax sp.]|nr:THUMP domain-containing protein [Bacteriovorax sp.]